MIAKPSERFVLDRLETPLGGALLVVDGEGCLRALDWEEHEPRIVRSLRLRYGAGAGLEAGRAPAGVIAALEAYFAGDLGRLDTIPCRTVGTPFQRAIWAALRTIPAGQTLSYGALATGLGVPRAVRAVGHANGANPISVVIPCHRLIGADGALTGYGGGLERKRWLLMHEGAAFVGRTAPRA
ncbi:MAG: methylated-DNA--[protein]-cysteine S-methyltransferase [Dehalococcoidia bacterium]